jgi:ribonuclease P protein component
MPSYSFTVAQRLKNQTDFQRVLKRGWREARGPIVAHAMVAGERVKKSRLGIRIGRRCGTAPVRNRIKRLLRESFRLMQHDWPRPFDLVVTVKPHDVLMLAEYQRLLAGVMVKMVTRAGKPPASAS